MSLVEPKEKRSPIGEITEVLMETFKFATIQETQEILYYDFGVYVYGGEIIIEKHAEQYLGYSLSNTQLSEIKGHIRRRTYHKREEFDADINTINLKNGLYDIERNRLADHTPDYLSLNQKPIVHNKKAKSKLFGKFLSEVLDAKDIRTALEAIAYTFHRDCPIEVFFILHGVGANGKSVFTSVLSRLHGNDNISNIPLTTLLYQRFGLSGLENKDVNVDNELVSDTIGDTAIIKRLTGGSRQKIRVERKNKDAYDITIHAKLFFNANKVPETADNSIAYNRRVITITFPNIFEKGKEDKKLLSKLTTQEELSGLFNSLMIALRRILSTGEVYVNERTIEEKALKYERSVNPIKSFIKEMVAEDSTVSESISKREFYEEYVLYCKQNMIPWEKYDTFCKKVKKLEYRKDIDLDIRDGREGPDRVHVWKGIRLIRRGRQLAIEEVV